ncbi:MAG: 50S ribosomal protein L23 [Flavobacteriales bacterium AspAUS03]
MTVLIKPLITEKATSDSEVANRYTFLVDPRANKIQIKNELAQFYDVTVKNVRTMNYGAKKKSRFRKKARISGWTNRTKKAIIELEVGQTINFFSKN